MKTRQNDCYLTYTDTIIRIQEVPAKIDDYFSPVLQGPEDSLKRAVLNACLNQDEIYTRHQIKEGLAVRTDISRNEDDTRVVQFSKLNGALLQGFSVGKHDDIDKDALVRLFGDGLVLQLEKDKQFLETLEIEEIVPSIFIKDGDSCICTYIEPKYLTDRMELTDEGKEHYKVDKPRDYLKKFKDFIKAPVAQRYEEFDRQGHKLGEKDQMPEVKRFLGNCKNIEDAVENLIKGRTMENELTRMSKPKRKEYDDLQRSR